MCDYAKRHGKPFLNKDQVKKIATAAKKSGIKLIRFTGGEPLLDSNTPDYIEYLHKQGFKTSIITNGYLLPLHAASLAKKGLDQVVLSLDGSTPEIHDKLRNLPGIFLNATKGIRDIKLSNKNVIIRVNTVVSHHNIGDLGKMLNLLSKLGVDQWSLIPIKGPGNLWQNRKLSNWLKIYEDFKILVRKIDKPKLLGYSKQWAGRNKSETVRYFTEGIPYTPKSKCELVKKVRFYIPQSDKLAACNCVPWRLRDVDFNNNVTLEGLNDGTIQPLVTYLNNNGSRICKGCEPINAFLGEHPDILEDDIFSF